MYRSGALWFGRAAGLSPRCCCSRGCRSLSYGVRAYVDVPYLLLRAGRAARGDPPPPRGAPVLGLLALAGLLRPEAWAFSGLYWLYLLADRAARAETVRPRPLAWLAARAPPLRVGGSDWLVTGNPLWSLTNTRHTAETLDRVTGIANVPEYIPRRIGEILGPPVLVGGRARGGAGAVVAARPGPPGARSSGVIAVAVFAVFATRRAADRHALRVPRRGDPVRVLRRGRVRLAGCSSAATRAGAGGWRPARSSLVGARGVRPLASTAPAHRNWSTGRPAAHRSDLRALVRNGAISARCGPVGVPNHAPVPLLAL